MAKEQTNNAPTLSIEGGKELSIADLQSQLKTAEKGDSLNSEYFTIEDGVEYKVVFMGMSEIKGKGEKSNQLVPAVKLMDSADGKIKINADVVLVSTCQSLDLKGRINVPLMIVSKGFVAGGAGEYRDLQINELKFK